MTPEHQRSDSGAKPARRRQKQRNAFYRVVAEFKSRNPTATAADAWRHFVAVAGIGCNDVVLRYDATRDALEYAPDPGRRGTRTVARKTFFNQWFNLARLPAESF